MFIYKITNTVNGKSYIGLETGEEFSRWKYHRRSYKHGGQAIHQAMRKYGEENFICEQIDSSDCLVDLVIKEVEWIAKLNTFGKNGYNNSPGGELCIDIPVEDITSNDLQKLSNIRSSIMSNMNHIRWSNLTEEERKDFATKHLHSPEATKKRSKTITEEWATMPENERNNKLRGLKTQWEGLSVEERQRRTKRNGGLFTTKKWKIEWKNGDIEILENGLSQFCKEHDLIPESVRNYADKGSFYKNLFKVYRIND